MIERKIGSINGQIVFMTLAFMIVSTGWAQNHDLVMSPAPDITSSGPADWKAPDLKIGADFGDTSVPNIVRRGATNHIYARFCINGMQDHTIPSGDIEIKFHYRSASLGDTPPALSDPSWNYIDKLLATYVTSDGPFAITRVWPTDFPSVTTKSVSWDAPLSGDYFHVAAEVVYSPLTGIVDENPDDNVAVSLYESQSGLLDVVLLLDTSGSMGYYTYDGYTYMALAESKARAFVNSMNDNHRFAVVAFSSSYGGGTQDVWPTPTASLQPANFANKGLADLAIGGLSAGGNTPLGAGLDRAIQVLTTSLTPDRKRVILLLSDGYENTGSPRACSGSDPANPCVSGIIVSQLQTHNIKVFPIALGTAAWADCLECLAVQSDGVWVATPNAGIALMADLLEMQQVYSGDDLYRVDRGVNGGGDDTYSTYFEGVDDVLYFVLSWDDLDAELDLQLRPPRGTWSRPKELSNASARRGKGYVVVRVGKPAGGPWGYRVTGDGGKDYLVAVRSNRVGVRLEMDAKSEGIAGGFIKIQAHLADGKKPVTNAKLTATIQVPVKASLETTLRQASRDYVLKYKKPPVDPTVLKRNPDISPRAAFIRKITGDKQELLVKTRSINVPLQHTGNGFYSGVLKGAYTTTAGVYRVTVKCSEKRFHRNFSRQLRLHPGKIDPTRSFSEILEVKSIKGQSTWLLRIYPADKFGNAITATSLVDQVKVKVKGAELVKKPEIIYDSAIQQQLRVSLRPKPKLEMVKIGDEEMKIMEADPIRIRLK